MWGMEQMPAALAQKQKNMLLVGVASLRSPRRERPSGRGLGAWRNDNSLYHRKNKRTDTLPPRRAVMWGMEQMPAAPAHKNKKHVITGR